MEGWQQIRVGKPSGRTSDCVPFDTETHTSHIGPAISIINDGEVPPSLVFDKSRLTHVNAAAGAGPWA